MVEALKIQDNETNQSEYADTATDLLALTQDKDVRMDLRKTADAEFQILADSNEPGAVTLKKIADAQKTSLLKKSVDQRNYADSGVAYLIAKLHGISNNQLVAAPGQGKQLLHDVLSSINRSLVIEGGEEGEEEEREGEEREGEEREGEEREREGGEGEEEREREGEGGEEEREGEKKEKKDESGGKTSPKPQLTEAQGSIIDAVTVSGRIANLKDALNKEATITLDNGRERKVNLSNKEKAQFVVGLDNLEEMLIGLPEDERKAKYDEAVALMKESDHVILDRQNQNGKLQPLTGKKLEKKERAYLRNVLLPELDKPLYTQGMDSEEELLIDPAIAASKETYEQQAEGLNEKKNELLTTQKEIITAQKIIAESITTIQANQRIIDEIGATSATKEIQNNITKAQQELQKALIDLHGQDAIGKTIEGSELKIDATMVSTHMKILPQDPNDPITFKQSLYEQKTNQQEEISRREEDYHEAKYAYDQLITSTTESQREEITTQYKANMLQVKQNLLSVNQQKEQVVTSLGEAQELLATTQDEIAALQASGVFINGTDATPFYSRLAQQEKAVTQLENQLTTIQLAEITYKQSELYAQKQLHEFEKAAVGENIALLTDQQNKLTFQDANLGIQLDDLNTMKRGLTAHGISNDEDLLSELNDQINGITAEIAAIQGELTDITTKITGYTTQQQEINQYIATADTGLQLFENVKKSQDIIIRHERLVAQRDELTKEYKEYGTNGDIYSKKMSEISAQKKNDKLSETDRLTLNQEEKITEKLIKLNNNELSRIDALLKPINVQIATMEDTEKGTLVVAKQKVEEGKETYGAQYDKALQTEVYTGPELIDIRPQIDAIGNNESMIVDEDESGNDVGVPLINHGSINADGLV